MTVLLACSKKEPEPCYICQTTTTQFNSPGSTGSLPPPTTDSTSVCGNVARDNKLAAGNAQYVLGSRTVFLTTTCQAK
ncbi:hypothetical protein A6C57_23590 [Fibrella sp. ES10-3-2-2]|nr:hypothetical protein A6C57_23590 [Fibrella sp. ES10-3-2-2]